MWSVSSVASLAQALWAGTSRDNDDRNTAHNTRPLTSAQRRRPGDRATEDRPRSASGTRRERRSAVATRSRPIVALCALIERPRKSAAPSAPWYSGARPDSAPPLAARTAQIRGPKTTAERKCDFCRHASFHERGAGGVGRRAGLAGPARERESSRGGGGARRRPGAGVPGLRR